MVLIFIIDDEPMLHVLYREIFELNGDRIVAEAFDGEEAVRIFFEMMRKPDIILMDYRMPNKDGIEATREILEADPDARIVFASADSSIKQRALEGGAVGFLSKPFGIDALLKTINNIVAK